MKAFPFHIIVLTFCGVCTAGASQLGDDFLPGDEIEMSDYSVNDISSQKSAAMVAFTEYMLEKDPLLRLDKLALAMDNDPDDTVPLGCYLRELEQVNDKKEVEKRIAVLVSLAKKHPLAVRLNMSAAYFLSNANDNKAVIALTEKCLNKVDFDKLPPKQLPYYLNIISIAGKAFIADKDFSGGGDFFSGLLDNKTLSDNPRLLSFAALFYSAAMEKGEDRKGFWWFSESSRKRWERLRNECFSRLEKLCFSQTCDPSDLALVLDICKQTGNTGRGTDMLYSLMLSNPDDIKLRIFLAVYYFNITSFEESFRAWREVLQREPSREKFYLELAKAAEGSGRYSIAAAAYRNYLKSEPGDKGTIYKLAALHMREGEYQECLEVCSRMPENPLALYLSSLAYRQMKRYQEAYKAMIAARDMFIKMNLAVLVNDDFKRSMALVAERCGKIKEAEELVSELLKKNPDDPMLQNFLGYLWTDRDTNLPEAAKLLSSALEKIPDSAAINDSMAWLRYRQKDFPAARKYIELALKYSGVVPDAVIAAHAGYIYAACGDTGMAKKFLSMALEIYSPDDEVDCDAVRKRLAELDAKNGK